MLHPQLLQHLELMCDDDERSEKELLPNDNHKENQDADDDHSAGARSNKRHLNEQEEGEVVASDIPFNIARTWTRPQSIEVSTALVVLSISRFVEQDRSFSLLRNLLWMSFGVLLLWRVVPQWSFSCTSTPKTSAANVEKTQPPETDAFPLQQSTNTFAMWESQRMDVRCSVMSLLGSIGAPPPRMCRQSVAAGSGAGLRRLSPPFDLGLLQTLTEEHVKVIHRVDSSIEWIKHGYRMRCGLLECQGLGRERRMSSPILCTPSVERLEQATVSRLLQSGKQATRPLPLSTLRNNLVHVLLQQEVVLQQCLGKWCRVDNDEDLSSIRTTPRIVTIAWLRQQRQINANLLSQVIDDAFDSMVDDDDKSANKLDQAELTNQFAQATNVAKQLHAYLQAGLPANVLQSASDYQGGLEHPEQESRMQALRQQSLALSVASLCFHESVCSPPVRLVPDDRAFWWDKVRDHTSNLSSIVQELDALMIPKDQCLETGSPLPQDAESNVEWQVNTPVHHVEEYVVVQHEREGQQLQETEPTRGTSTLVYTGKGAILNHSSQRSQTKSTACQSGSTPSVVPPWDAKLHHSLIQELQGRLAQVDSFEVAVLSLADECEASNPVGKSATPDSGEPMHDTMAPLFMEDLQRAILSSIPSALAIEGCEFSDGHV